MVKLIYIIITLIAISCTREDNVSYLAEKGVVTFSVAEESRATQENNKFEKGDAIGVYAIDPQTKEFWGKNNKYVYDGTEFHPATEDDNIIITKGYDLDFYIYYPYSENQQSVENIQYSVSDQIDKNSWLAADFMVATYTDAITDYTIPLHFYRKNATVKVTVNRNDGVTGAKIQNVCYGGAYNLLKGSGTVSDNRKDIQMYRLSESGNTITFCATLPIQTLATQSNYIILSGNRENKLTSNKHITLKEGEIQNYTIDYQKEIKIIDYLPGGTTKGAGTYSIGESCIVTSTPNSGYSFIGWYENNALVSPSQSYTFTITEDRSLEPRYKNFDAWSVSLTAEPTEIKTAGGTSNITASASRKVYINGQESNTETINYPSDGRLKVTSSDTNNFIVEGTTVRVTENTTTSTRTATITAICEGVNNSVTLTQPGRIETYVFTIDQDGYMGCTSEVSSQKFNIISSKTIVIDGNSRQEDVSWSVSTQDNWYSITKDGTVTVTENNSKDERLAEIILTQSGSNKTLTIYIEQDGKNEVIIPPTR